MTKRAQQEKTAEKLWREDIKTAKALLGVITERLWHTHPVDQIGTVRFSTPSAPFSTDYQVPFSAEELSWTRTDPHRFVGLVEDYWGPIRDAQKKATVQQAPNWDRRLHANTVVTNVANKMAFEATGVAGRLKAFGQLVVNEDESADALLSWTWEYDGEKLDMAASVRMSEQERDQLTEMWLWQKLLAEGKGPDWLRNRRQAVQEANRPLPAFGTRTITVTEAAEATKAAVEVAVKQSVDEVRNRSLREQNTQLVTEMVAGAGFELVDHGNDPIPFYATWEQILPERTNVKVTLALSARELELPPAQVFRIVFDQVGAK